MTSATLIVEPDTESASAAAAHFIANRLTAVEQAQGRTAIAFSGGSTPAQMFKALATLVVPWAGVDIFQVDERVVPKDDPQSNWHSLRTWLLDPAEVPAEKCHRMNVGHPDLTVSAGEYAATLRSLAPNGVDLIHLGLGDDGHTASWPPGDPVIRSAADVMVVGPYRGIRRMTLTPQVVNRAEIRLWLVSGADKRAALKALLRQDHRIPASSARTEPGDVIFADAAAAGNA